MHGLRRLRQRLPVGRDELCLSARVPTWAPRLKTVLQTYRNAGGKIACLLFHNATDGRDLVAKLGRRGKGLPAARHPARSLSRCGAGHRI